MVAWKVLERERAWWGGAAVERLLAAGDELISRSSTVAARASTWCIACCVVGSYSIDSAGAIKLYSLSTSLFVVAASAWKAFPAKLP